jgi:hypothetical protein
METVPGSQVRIRAWDMTASTEYKCQIVFTLDDQGETSFVESSICQNAHYASKLRNAAMAAFNLQFGQRPAEPSPAVEPVADSDALVHTQPTEMTM